MRKFKILFFLVFIQLNIYAQKDVFKDIRDNHVYKMVKIGKQIWFAENLAYKAKTDCWAYDNDTSNVAKYGYLYSYETAMNSCPTGWHLPNDTEWSELIIEVGGKDVAGGKLKSKNGWKGTNLGASDKKGFSILPAGERDNTNGHFNEMLNSSTFWTSSPYDGGLLGTPETAAWGYTFMSIYKKVIHTGQIKKLGLSVRCIKD